MKSILPSLDPKNDDYGELLESEFYLLEYTVCEFTNFSALREIKFDKWKTAKSIILISRKIRDVEKFLIFHIVEMMLLSFI